MLTIRFPNGVAVTYADANTLQIEKRSFGCCLG